MIDQNKSELELIASTLAKTQPYCKLSVAIVDLGDSLAGLGAETTLFLSKDIRGNTFKGNLGKLIDNAPKGANQY